MLIILSYLLCAGMLDAFLLETAPYSYHDGLSLAAQLMSQRQETAGAQPHHKQTRVEPASQAEAQQQQPDEQPPAHQSGTPKPQQQQDTNKPPLEELMQQSQQGHMHPRRQQQQQYEEDSTLGMGRCAGLETADDQHKQQQQAVDEVIIRQRQKVDAVPVAADVTHEQQQCDTSEANERTTASAPQPSAMQDSAADNLAAVAVAAGLHSDTATIPISQLLAHKDATRDAEVLSEEALEKMMAAVQRGGDVP